MRKSPAVDPTRGLRHVPVVQFPSPLIGGVLVRRYKRFFADVRLETGEVVTAHCANPGSMKTCAIEGSPVWLSRAQNPRRQLRFTWELAEVDGQRVYVNPSGANQLAVEALKRRKLSALAGYDVLLREVRYGESSRIDILLRGASRCYVEVKNVTMSYGDGVAAFPDSVTERGRKHLHELTRVVAQGERGVMLFCASREGARAVVPADEIDAEYGQALRHAQRNGVELLAYQVRFGEQEITLGEEIPVRLP